MVGSLGKVGAIKRILIAAAVVLALSPGLGAAQSESPPASPLIAVAVNGNIVLFRADGGQRTTLTRRGLDSSPVVSPDGRTFAFWRTPVTRQAGSPDVGTRQVMLASPNLHNNPYHIIVFSQHPASWSLQGRRAEHSLL